MSNSHYLDTSGLSHVWDKLKAYFYPKTGGNISGDVDIDGDLTFNIDDPDYDVALELSPRLDPNRGIVMGVDGTASGTHYKTVWENVGTPVNNFDAANKKYVDDLVKVEWLTGAKDSSGIIVSSNSYQKCFDCATLNVPCYLKVTSADTQSAPGEVEIFRLKAWINYNGHNAHQDSFLFVDLATGTRTKQVVIEYGDVATYSEVDFDSIFSTFEVSSNKVIAWSSTPTDTHYPSEKLVKDNFDTVNADINWIKTVYSRIPDIVWQETIPANYLKAINTDLSANPSWQLTDLDLTPYKRIRIHACAGQKSGTTASASTTPGIVLEMSLDPRAAIAAYGGNYVASVMVQKPNDANRLASLTCAVSADKTKFVVLRQTSLYGTAATSNNDVNANVFLIEGCYDAGEGNGIPIATQSDWEQTDSSRMDFIKNKPDLAPVATSGSYNELTDKPTIPTKVSELTNDAGFATASSLSTVATSGSYNDLSNKPTIPAAQIQSDWGQANTSAVDYIKNKPTLAAVATTGDYGDLVNTPTIPTVPTNVSAFTNDAGYAESSDLATVATTGSYNDLSNKPTIPVVPTDVSAFTNDAGYAVSSNLATVATSGSYNDLTNKPDLDPIFRATYGSTSYIEISSALSANKTVVCVINQTDVDNSTLLTNDYIGFYVLSGRQDTVLWTFTQIKQPNSSTSLAKLYTIAVSKYAAGFGENGWLPKNNGDFVSPATASTLGTVKPDGTSITVDANGTISAVASAVTWDAVTDKPTFATVATSGSYNDLSNKPTIPAAQIQSDWTQTTTTAKDYIKNKPSLSTVATTGDYDDLSNKPTIPTVPTNVSSFTNDSGYQTASQVSSAISSAIGGITGISYEVVQTLPASGSAGVIYLVPNSGSGSNIYDEYIYVNNAFEKIGTTAVDLSDYVTDTDLATALADYTTTANLSTVATSGSYNDLTNKPTIPAAQIQSDWTQTNTSAKDFIKNKPTLSAVATSGAYSDLSGTPTLATVATSGSYNDLSNKPTIPAAQIQSDWTQTTTTAKDYIKNKPTLATVATSGSYNDLSNKPTIPAEQIQSNWAQTTTTALDYIKNKPTLATVATSGSYNDLSNKPTIPAAQIQSDWTQTTTSAKDYIKNKPTLSAVATSGAYSDLSGKPTLATVATSGSYNDLSNKPTIPAAQVQANWTQTSSSAVDYIKNKPTFATVATSGSYNDLTNKPTIPAAQIQADWNQTTTTALDYIKNKPNVLTSVPNASATTVGGIKTYWDSSTSTLYITNNGNNPTPA